MVANLEGYTQAAFDELSAPMAEAESCDLVDGLSFRLPLLVIARMLGVPASDADMIHAWTLPMAAFMDRQDLSHIAPWHAAMQEFRGYVGELVRTMRGAPAETNLIAALLEASDEGTMTGEELVATFVILLFAGHETTTNLISNGVYRLLDGDGWDELRREPELAESAVEEMLRYDPPVQFTQRVPIVEVDVEGTTIAPNTTVMLMLAAANRDPRAWSEPDRFDIRRPRNRHLSFALGPVFCLGASLARMEARIVFSTLARRHPGLALAGEPEWAANAQLRGPVHLPVSLRSR
jgi:cytochrome P450